MVDEYVWDKYFINCTSEFLWTVVSRGGSLISHIWAKCPVISSVPLLCGALLFSKLVRHTVLKCFKFCSKMRFTYRNRCIKSSSYLIVLQSDFRFWTWILLWQLGDVPSSSVPLLCGALLFSKLVQRPMEKRIAFC